MFKWVTFKQCLVEELSKADGHIRILHTVFATQDDGRVDGHGAEEFDGLVDEDGRHGDDDEEDEGDAQNLGSISPNICEKLDQFACIFIIKCKVI